MPKGCKPPTLCWDCARAIGPREKRCSWSNDFKPVKGWDADFTVVHAGNAGETTSYLVRSCPEFVRDAWDGGARRKEEGSKWAEVCTALGVD